MVYVPIEDLLRNTGNNIYKLVILASRRAVELGAGSEKLVEVPANTKLTSIALEEIREKKIGLKTKKQ